MKTAYLLHGRPDIEEYMEMEFPSPSNAHWFPWLQQKFLRDGVLCQTLEMPLPYAPVYEDWDRAFSQAQLEDDSIIVAHSIGCGFILKWLHKHPAIKLGKLVLVAPWLDPAGQHGDFLKPASLPDQNRLGDIHIFYSTDEPVGGVAESKDKILAAYDRAILHTFTDKGHFCFGDLGGPAFEELWAVCR